jgi:hypothetical protein
VRLTNEPAGAHQLARILYAMLTTRQTYDEAKAFS